MAYSPISNADGNTSKTMGIAETNSPLSEGLFSFQGFKANQRISGDIKYILSRIPKLQLSRIMESGLLMAAPSIKARTITVRRAQDGMMKTYTTAMSGVGINPGYQKPQVLEFQVHLDTSLFEGVELESIDTGLISQAGVISQERVKQFMQHGFIIQDLVWLNIAVSNLEYLSTEGTDANGDPTSAPNPENVLGLTPTQLLIDSREKALQIYDKIGQMINTALNHPTKFGQVIKDNLVMFISRRLSRYLELAEAGITFSNTRVLRGSSLELKPFDKVYGINAIVHPLLGRDIPAGTYHEHIGANTKDYLAILVERIPTEYGTTSCIVGAYGQTRIYSGLWGPNQAPYNGYKSVFGMGLWDNMRTRMWGIKSIPEPTGN